MTQRTHEQAIIAALPGTLPQIIQKSGVSRPTAYLWIGRLRKAGKVFIKGWRRTAGQSTPYYVAGQGEDKPRPAAQTNAEYHRRHYAKHRGPIEREDRAIRKAARLNAAAMAKTPQSWLSALGA
jgi:hypothetical protein